MTLKHTPGPWIAGQDEDSDYFLVGPHDDWLVTNPVVTLHDEANARLIAAAPELLEELENCLDLLKTCFPDVPSDSCIGAALSKASYAIAKAGGTS